MNRTQRKQKKTLRGYENGRASFKKIYLQPSLADPAAPINREEVKRMQREQKMARKDTRDYKVSCSRHITAKEVSEV
jgi:hypothetical protein